MPSNKFNYVMTVNNSKLARKPYYKNLLKNHFEKLFTQMMEHQTVINGQSHGFDIPNKLAILYKVYNSGSTTKKEKIY
jgi:hypothetical protein